MMTEIVDCEESALAIGMELRVAFRQEEGCEAVPVFRPEADA